jgi:eukaryotic-like serine/threonine-protein kinase
MQSLETDDPRAIGGFRLRVRLGDGGMGRVYLGLSSSGRVVAVKVLHPELARDTDFLRRFRREVAAARGVSGMYTAPVVATGLDARPPWLATAFVPGPSLEQVVRERGPLPPGAVWPLFGGLVEALAAIHSSGVIHRDLKPSNVLLAADGPRVIDFGIARAADGNALTATGMVFGSPAYMSPEQAEGRSTGAAADVFSLGSLICFAGAGAPPFGEGNAPSVLYRVVHEPPVLDALPPRLRSIVAQCLAKKPAERPGLTALGVSIEAEIAAGTDGSGTGVLSFWPAQVTRHIEGYRAGVEAQLGLGDGAIGPATSVAPRKTLVLAEPDEAAVRAAAARAAAVRARVPGTVLAGTRLMYAGAGYALLFAACARLIGMTNVSHHLVLWPGHWIIRSVQGLTIITGIDAGCQVLLWLWMAVACRNGRSWARWACTALLTVYTAGFGYALTQHVHDGVDQLGTALLAGTWLIGAAAVALLWQRRSSAFFRRQPRPQRVP